MIEPQDYAAPMTRLATLHSELGWALRDSRTQPHLLDSAHSCLFQMRKELCALEHYVRIRRGE